MASAEAERCAPIAPFYGPGRRRFGTPLVGLRFPGMPQANINDRGSIERVYPTDAFARDAAENDRHRIELLKGVRIASAPDEAGNFALEPAAQYTGEVPGTPFLAPFHRRTAEEYAADDPDPLHGYNAFIDDIVEAARHRGYRPEDSPGPGDRRLRGLRQ